MERFNEIVSRIQVNDEINAKGLESPRVQQDSQRGLESLSDYRSDIEGQEGK